MSVRHNRNVSSVARDKERPSHFSVGPLVVLPPRWVQFVVPMPNPNLKFVTGYTANCET